MGSQRVDMTEWLNNMMQCERCSDRKINPGDKPCYSLLTSSLNKYSVITIWRTGSLGPIWEEVAPFFERWKCRALITALAARWGLDRGAWKRHGGQLVLGRLLGRGGPWAEMGWWIRREPKRDFSRERNMIKLMEVGWAGIPQLVAHMCNSWTLRGWSVFWEEVTSEGNDTPLQCPCLENPMMEEPGRLQSIGSRRVGYDWATSLSLFICTHWRRKWQPTPLFLPGESQGQRPGGLPSMGSHRVGHNWSDLAAAAPPPEQGPVLGTGDLEKKEMCPCPQRACCLSGKQTHNYRLEQR